MPWREVRNSPPHIGDLISHTVQMAGEQYRVLTLTPSDPMAPRLVAELYEPVLTGFAPLAFRLRGFERVDGKDGRFSVVQEWHCEMP